MGFNLRSRFSDVCIAVALVSSFLGCGTKGNGEPPPPGAPEIISTPSSHAAEGGLYQYNVQATGTNVTYQLATAPNGATLNGSVVNWTPAREQSRVANAFEVTATNSAGSARQHWEVTPTGTVRVSCTYNYYFTSTASSTYQFSGNTSVSAMALDGSKIGDGVLAPDGAIVVRNVPGGPFWLVSPSGVGPTFNKAVESSFDCGSDYFGRPSPQLATSAKLSGLISNVPYYLYGFLHWIVPNIGEDTSMWITRIDASTVNVGTASDLPDTRYLADASKEDVGYLVQSNRAYYDNGVVSWEWVLGSRGYTVTQSNGTTTDLTGELSTPSTAKIPFSVDTANFTQHIGAVYPSGTLAGGRLGLYAFVVPVSAAGQFVWETAPGREPEPPAWRTFWRMNTSRYPTATLSGNMPLNDLFPPDVWRPVLKVEYKDKVIWTLPDTCWDPSGSYPCSGSIEVEAGSVEWLSSDITNWSVTLPLSPVQKFMVDGTSAHVVHQISANPLVSWDPPSTGMLYYILHYCSPYAGSDLGKVKAAVCPEVSFGTDEPRVQIPPGMLESGKSYFFWVTAYAHAHVGLSSPLRRTLPLAWSTAVSVQLPVQ